MELEEKLSDKIVKYMDKDDTVMACYCYFLRNKVKGVTDPPQESILRILENIEEKNCPECGSREKEYELIITTEDLVVQKVKCKECGLGYTALKLPRYIYEKFSELHKEESIRTGSLLSLVQYMKNAYKQEKKYIISSYYAHWLDRLRTFSVNPVEASKIIYNWDHVCGKCGKHDEKKFKHLDTEEPSEIFLYTCSVCGNDFGKISIPKENLIKPRT